MPGKPNGKLSTQIVEAGGEYVWIGKDNQPKDARGN